MGEPVAISAEHGEGMGDLFEALLPFIEGDEDEAEPPSTPRTRRR
jgi:GTP-binding protein